MVSHGLDELVYGSARDDRAQRLRLRRFYMAAVSYAMWYGLALLAWATDLLDASGPILALCGVGIALTQLAFYWLLRSGRNLAYADPALTFPQIGIALCWSLLLLAFTSELRGLLLSGLMVALLF